MPLTVEQDERLTLLLQGLEPCLKEVGPSSRKFVEDQIARHGEYGDRVFMLPKQWAWLIDLYKKHVGGELPGDDDHRGPEHTARDEMRQEELEARRFELDDEAPF